jgi:YYY domain-containing protein
MVTLAVLQRANTEKQPEQTKECYQKECREPRHGEKVTNERYPRNPSLSACESGLHPSRYPETIRAPMRSFMRSILMLRLGEPALVALPALLVLFLLFFRAVQFSSIYSEPHAYELASEWIFKNISPGQRIIGVHWDDRLPLSLPGKSAHIYDFEGEENTLNLYDRPDDLEKLSITSARLARGDYLILPTYRLPGSIPRKAADYPVSTRFFQLLFAERLGFKLVQTVKVRPSFAGIEQNDDLADESFWVYDHPKIAIFQNIDRLSSGEIFHRISTPLPNGALPNREEILLQDSGSSNVGVSKRCSPVAQVVVWILSLQALAFGVFPLMARCFRSFPDRGYGLSKVFGLFALGSVSWFLSATGITAFSAGVVQLIGLGICFSGAIQLFRRTDEGQALRHVVRSQWIPVEAIFLGVTLIFLGIRALNPEITWGEKPMDFTFLNFFIRTDTLPPQDPWAAGQRMHYYYVGIAYLSALLKAIPIDPAVGFNLAIATLGGFVSVSLYSLTLAVTARKLWGIVAALLIVFVSNFETIRLKLVDGKAVNFDSFWSSSRVFASPAFSEYTLWSMLFADLHAHVVSIPFCMLFIALLYVLLAGSVDRFKWNGIILRFLTGIVWGGLFVGNTWDFITFGAFLGLVVLFADKPTFWTPCPSPETFKVPWGERLLALTVSSVPALCWDVVLIGGAAAIIILPFSIGTPTSELLGYGWVQALEFNTPRQILLFLGHWYIIAILAVAVATVAYARRCPWALIAGALSAVLPFAFKGSVGLIASVMVMVFSRQNAFAPLVVEPHMSALPWGVLTLSAVLMGLAGYLAVVRREFRFGALLVWSSAFAISVAEQIYLFDRMNTIFKVYMFIGLTMAVGALLLWSLVDRSLRNGSILQDWRSELRLGLNGACLFCLALPIVGSVMNTYAVVSTQRVDRRVMTLDGMHFFTYQWIDEGKAFQWIADHVPGTPVILEACGDSYQDYGRYSMYTGLPTVLGWDHHVRQRGTTAAMVQQRKRDVREIYATPDIDRAEHLLLQYGVDLVVVGRLEHRDYPAFGLDKFSSNPTRFPKLFESGQVTIYATRFSEFNPERGLRARTVVERR